MHKIFLKLLSFFGRFIIKLIIKFFFTGVEIIGKENIPEEGPIIFVGNHQNQFIVKI